MLAEGIHHLLYKLHSAICAKLVKTLMPVQVIS